MNREDFQSLALTRLNDAGILLDHKNYSGAYYLSGYVIECALKACIAKQTKQFDFPDKTITNKVHTHDLSILLSFSGLSVEKDEESKRNPEFELNWTLVKDWNESSRYKFYDEKQANDLFKAVVDEDGGILEWIKRFW